MRGDEARTARWWFGAMVVVAACTFGVTAASASGGGSVVAGQGVLQQEASVVEDCDYDTFTCYFDYAGGAVLDGRVGTWAFTARMGHLVFPGCRQSSGTWTLTNGRGDSLAGAMTNAAGSVSMSITGGTGHYAGRTASMQAQPDFGGIDPPFGGCPANPRGYQGRIELTLSP